MVPTPAQYGAACPVAKTLYYPSSSKPYTTYISNRAVAVEESNPVRDSRIGEPVFVKKLQFARKIGVPLPYRFLNKILRIIF